MTKITSFDITPLYRNAVGIDRLFDRITRNLDASNSVGNYPPYDIIRNGDDSYEVRIAAAGFCQDEIEVEVQDGDLKIHGVRAGTAVSELEYLHHGISNRNFLRTFSLGPYMEVKEAIMKDGILTIKIEQIVPESLKPKKISISYQS
jgi:molecular chaperone IbpA